MNHERCQFYSQWVSENCEDKRLLFQKAKKLLGLKQCTSTPFSGAITAQEFADFFTMKVDNIISKIDSLHPSQIPSHLDHKKASCSTITEFRKLSDQDISMVKSATCKTCEADPIPTTLLKSSIHTFITHQPMVGLEPFLKKLP